ncbi:hypothetical protein OAT67_06840 [Bacteriovoracaceae bacterium]|nr:hypothetical protein [Bacteriovoracaceae bacterium]|tara:strand:- start:349326 stop:349601 length:276 start_codon:yes stop_codon:yes gene_type:complete
MKKLIYLLPLLIVSCDFPKVIPTTFAKDYCSCRYVVGQSKEYCLMYSKQIISPTSWSENPTEKVVVANFITKEAIVKYESKRYGCRIVSNN